MNAANVADGSAGKTIPPGRQPLQVAAQLCAQGLVSHGGRLAGQARIESEGLFDDLDQLVNARIADAVLPRTEERKQALKAEDVPRIDKGTTGNAASQ